MTLMVTWSESDPSTETFRSEDREQIREKLAPLGVDFQLWPVLDIDFDSTAEEVYAAYDEQIAPFKEAGYTTLDVIGLRDNGEADFAEKAAKARGTFLSEHTHDDDEVRYFIDGAGTFYLHVGDQVHAILCEQGDLMNVPEGTTHWFDMGAASPRFKAIRFFRIPEGWVGKFTGSTISENFPTHDELQASRAAGAGA